MKNTNEKQAKAISSPAGIPFLFNEGDEESKIM